MAYIELHQPVLTHRKTIRLAGRLGIKRVYAVGHLAALWCWALDNAPSGDLSEIDPEGIAFGAEWDADAQQFLDAMVYAGFIDRTDSEGDQMALALHDWDEYGGKLISSRAANAERMRQARMKLSGAQSDIVQRTNANVSLKRRVEESRGEESRQEEPGPTRTRAKPATKTKLVITDELAGLLEYHRDCHGLGKPKSPNPTQVEAWEKLIVEVGVDRYRDGIHSLAERGEADIGKAGRWARTKMRGEQSSGGDYAKQQPTGRGMVPSGERGRGDDPRQNRQARTGSEAALPTPRLAQYSRSSDPRINALRENPGGERNAHRPQSATG